VNPVFTITNRIADRLRQVDQARGFLAAAKLSEDWINEMSRKALIREAHATTHIEGSQLTLEQAERLFAGKNAPGADPDDVRELLNYRKAFDFVADYVAGQEPITEGLIREIHKRLVEGVRGGSAEPGTYRKVQNYVVNSQTGKAVYTPPPAHDVPILMREMVEWCNTETDAHPVLVSGIAQFQLVHIHPFIDGNGRTSRLLSTLCLYRTGYDFKRLFTISEYYDRDRLAFYKAIQGVRDSGMDMTGWLEFYTDGLSTQMQEVTDKGTRIIKRDLLVQKHGLNERQGKALGFVLEHGKLHLRDYERLSPDVERRTLQRDLKALLQKNILAETGVGETDPNRAYVLLADGRKL
jgi:Fic family protein